MANTSDNQPTKRYEAAILLMPTPYAAVCRPAESQSAEFNQWWHAMTKLIEEQKTLPSVEEQYRLDLSREDRMERIPGLRDLFNEIEELETLEEDWNGESAPAINKAGIQQAQAFIKEIACAISDPSEVRLLPAVYPTTEGGVQLHWSATGGQTVLTFRPGRQNVDYVTKALGHPALCGSAPISEAVDMALRAMRNA